MITVEERGDGDYGANPLEFMSLAHKSDGGAHRRPHGIIVRRQAPPLHRGIDTCWKHPDTLAPLPVTMIG